MFSQTFGTAFGDFLYKPVEKGGLKLSRYSASAALLVLMLICILAFRQRASEKAHSTAINVHADKCGLLTT